MQNWDSDRPFGMKLASLALNKSWHRVGLLVVGIIATAAHHILLTLPNVVDGNQQTAHMMQDDILKDPIPIATAPDWGIPQGPGLGIEIDADKLGKYHELYRSRGQFVPYEPKTIGLPLYR